MDFPYEKDSKERMPYEHYMEIYRGLNPEDISSRANIPYNAESRTFTLRLMGVTYQVSWPDYEVRHLDREDLQYYPLEGAANARILVLRYLTEGAAAPATGKFLTYREVPWGEVYFKQFQGRCLFRLAYGFGNKLQKFREIMEKLGARKLPHGDAGYEFEFLNGLYLQFLLWEGDEEFPPSAQILFSDNFPVAFVMGEDMAVVGDVSIGALKALS
ncbi:MAG TPA: DUF3786 domain-containing protein [Candidatus Scatomonas merdigallinarum]|nr:DUF3786 domain-containing protein [Candidatus Scatomonas merdigallinarum]